MKDLEDFFSHYIAEEIIPEMSFEKTSVENTTFAVILDSGESISNPEIAEIKKRTRLCPIFWTFAASANTTPQFPMREAFVLR